MLLDPDGDWAGVVFQVITVEGDDEIVQGVECVPICGGECTDLMQELAYRASEIITEHIQNYGH